MIRNLFLSPRWGSINFAIDVTSNTTTALTALAQVTHREEYSLLTGPSYNYGGLMRLNV
jgi:hypothetical protein